MFNGSLFQTQKPAAEMLCNKRKVLLAWEQGTGKTIISIAAAEKLFQLGKAQHALIIAPTGLTWQWADKIKEFTDTTVHLVDAKKKDTRTYKPGPGRSYTTVGYNLFRNDFHLICNHNWDIVICDEAQEFKNNKSKTHKLLLALNRSVKPSYRWALTGTAISNKLEELYSIFYWIDRTFLPTWPVFEKTHIQRNRLKLISGYKNLQSLNKYLQVRMDRKTHHDLKGQLPTLLTKTVKVEKTTKYKKAEDKLLNTLDDMVASIKFDDEGEPQLPKNSKVSKAFNKCIEYLYEPKLRVAQRLIDEILTENTNNRIVVFSHRKAPLYALHEHYDKQATFFTGDQDSDAKRHSIKAFATSPHTRILLASDAGKAGLDLPFANYVIHLDVPFSHATLDQRNKRITRVGSTHSTVLAIYLVMQDSIEEFFFVVVTNKGRLASAVQEGKEDVVVVRPTSLREWIRRE